MAEGRLESARATQFRLSSVAREEAAELSVCPQPLRPVLPTVARGLDRLLLEALQVGADF